MEEKLITRSEAAQVLRLSERQWDRVRKTWTFTEVHVAGSSERKGLRFWYEEVLAYAKSREKKSS